MIDTLGEALTGAAIGLAGGLALGLAARLGRFCTLGAIEDALYGANDLRLRMWMLALGVAITGVHLLSLGGPLAPEATFYLRGGWNPLAHLIGGGLFGYGMALAGNCGYGALARLGGGDLRALMIVLVMGVTTHLAISGPLAPLRVALFPPDLLGQPSPPALSHGLAQISGLSAGAIGLAIGLGLTLVALLPRRVRASRATVLWGGVVGLAIVSGWAGTAWVHAVGFDALPVESHTFAAPLGDMLLYAMRGSAYAPGFGVGSVAGVLAGACIGSLLRGHFRWEACDDSRELRRQMLGAAAMGIGGAVAMGCSVGQGLTAFSLLALSAPVTLAGIGLGAWLGLRQLIHGFAPS